MDEQERRDSDGARLQKASEVFSCAVRTASLGLGLYIATVNVVSQYHGSLQFATVQVVREEV